jgi:hypothetical protein
MAFMEPEVTNKQEWAGVETTAGFWWVPIDVLSTSELESARRGDFEPLLKYTEGSKVYSDQSSLKKGYGVRLSARGYMDATDWEVYGSKKEALRRARELAAESEGDHATKASPRSRHTTETATLYHVYAPDGFESAHRSLNAAERMARRGAKNRRLEYRVYLADAHGMTGGGHGTLAYTANPPRR